MSRIATRGKTQLDQVVDHLVSSGLAAHPDRVYGVYRVPDRISPAMTSTSERGRVVEWDIVHEPTTAPTTAPTGARGAVSIASMSAWDHWVRRSVGESEVIDEELAIALCEVAGVRARDCFGIARSVGIRSLASGDDGSPSFPLARVEGVHVLASRPLDEALDGLTNAAPLDLPHDGWTGVHVAILNWGDIALAVHPQAQRMHVIPSPCHYLPSTPQELLTRYLQIVGVRAAHCFAASVTIDAMRELAGVGSRGFGMSNMGGDEMCADGKVRRRLHGASRVVIVYEDSPDYVAGRDRWQRYQDEVLQATLENGTGARAALAPVDHSDIENPFLRTLVKAASVYDAITMFGEAHAPPPYRYCIPFEPRR